MVIETEWGMNGAGASTALLHEVMLGRPVTELVWSGNLFEKRGNREPSLPSPTDIHWVYNCISV